MIYATYFIFLGVLCNVGNKKEALYLSLLLTFIFTGLSYPAGNDWIGYFVNYDCKINKICFDSFVSFEIGYQLIVNTIGQLGFIYINIFLSIIFIICLGFFSSQFENRVLITFFIMSMISWALYTEAVRQGVAISIFYIALYYLRKEDLIKYVLLVVLASMMHVTALVGLIMIIPYLSKSIAKVVMFGLFVFAVGFAMTPFTILNLFLNILPIDSSANIKLDYYLNSNDYMPQLSIGLGLIFDVLITVVLILTARKLKFQNIKNNKFFFSCLIGMSIYICFAVIIGRFMPVLTRIGWYFIPVIIIILYSNFGNSIFYEKLYKKNKVTNILILIYFIVQIIRPLTYAHSYYGITHQQTIFQNANNLDDASLRYAAAKKCGILRKLGYNDLCYL